MKTSNSTLDVLSQPWSASGTNSSVPVPLRSPPCETIRRHPQAGLPVDSSGDWPRVAARPLRPGEVDRNEELLLHEPARGAGLGLVSWPSLTCQSPSRQRRTGLKLCSTNSESCQWISLTQPRFRCLPLDIEALHRPKDNQNGRYTYGRPNLCADVNAVNYCSRHECYTQVPLSLHI
ncbi:hypothetical protein VTK56DRAFT_5702 [Thermocarpiscus australiensis]